MRARRFINLGLVCVLAGGALVAGGPARAAEVCVPSAESQTRVCVNDPDGFVTWEVVMNGAVLTSGSFRFTSPEAFHVGAHGPDKNVNVSVRRYWDPESGDVELEVCVTIRSFPEPVELCNQRDIP